MADVTLLVMGNTGMPAWGQDQIRRLSEQARRRGVTLVGADTPENLRSATARDLAHVDEVVALDVHHPEACRAWAATRPPVDAVLTVRELSVLPTAVIAQELGLAGNDPDAVRCVRTKDLCRQRLREAGFPQPRTAVCSGVAEAERFLAETGPGPWVVKPRDGLASIGVSLIDGPGQLPEAVRKFRLPSEAMSPLPASPYFLVETFVAGDEYSAEGIVLGGEPQVLALTRKAVTDGFISTSQQQPAGLAPATDRLARDTVARGLKAVGITRGVFHIELWVTATGIVLGEFHCRGGGDFIHALVEHTRPGLELYGTLVDDLLGRTPPPLPAPGRAARVDFLFAPPGRLRAVRGWDELAAHPAVLAADLRVRPGDVIPPEKDSFTRSGVFVTGADSPAERDEIATRLAGRVVFDTEADEGALALATDG
ncbi:MULTISPECIES: ATP-grasp domain-containing protein [Streptomyces]|uniref:ATP-grasp domain-containing protein n=1 Tax=Streptomyces TaxID=1883 RepID=UPI00163BF1EC|nr:MULTISPECIES: ATP-grasp domain-containing protein [Streptomyces]MBC2875414.1 ATP-grasp domain-containing protein [Streptomyces sp. TYQ1024]UBI35656.1 ATP-grasp domain-containing protein [Streptomyces mobaraensis]UKW28249.1 ATP-grasp domain-containing protein [Streptomyces sp. TYQ1024]